MTSLGWSKPECSAGMCSAVGLGLKGARGAPAVSLGTERSGESPPRPRTKAGGGGGGVNGLLFSPRFVKSAAAVCRHPSREGDFTSCVRSARVTLPTFFFTKAIGPVRFGCRSVWRAVSAKEIKNVSIRFFAKGQ